MASYHSCCQIQATSPISYIGSINVPTIRLVTELRSTTEDIGDKESHGGLAAGLAIAMVVCIAISGE